MSKQPAMIGANPRPTPGGFSKGARNYRDKITRREIQRLGLSDELRRATEAADRLLGARFFK